MRCSNSAKQSGSIITIHYLSLTSLMNMPALDIPERLSVKTLNLRAHQKTCAKIHVKLL